MNEKLNLIVVLVVFAAIGYYIYMGESNGESSGEPSGPHTSVEWQIWAYSTAAPSFIAENATVLNEKMDGPA